MKRALVLILVVSTGLASLANANFLLLVQGIIGVPVNVMLPSITGTPQVANTLSTTNGTWTNSPTSFAYQWTTSKPVFTDTLPTTGGSFQGFQARTVIPAANLTSPGITSGSIRVSFTLGAGTTNGTLSGAYIGEQGSGNAVNFDSNQVQLKFGGATTLTGLGSGAIVSDLIPFNFNSGVPLVISSFWTGTTVNSQKDTTSTNNTTYNSNVDTDPSATTPPNFPAQWSSQANTVHFIAEVEYSPVLIGGATASTYNPVSGDLGNTIQSRVTASNSVGTGAPALSPPTARVVAGGTGAARTAALSNILGVSGHAQSYSDQTHVVADAAYLGIHLWRDGLGVASTYAGMYANGIRFIGLTFGGPALDLTASVNGAKAIAALGAGALFAVEGPNEPGNFTMTYNGFSSASTWHGIGQFQSDFNNAIKAEPTLAGVQVWTPTNVYQEIDNYGLQYLTIPAGPPSGVLAAAGTVYADGRNSHVYPMFQGAAQSVDPTVGDAFVKLMNADFVTTANHGFAGVSLSVANSQPKAVTEFGYQATGGVPGGTATDFPTQGKDILSGWLNAYDKGYQALCIYTFYEGGPDNGFGLLHAPGVPNTSATYIHNFTTVFNDTGATANTFTTGSLNYTVSGLPSDGKSTIFQKSNGTFELVFWRNATNWNIAAGTPTTVSPTTVTVDFALKQKVVYTYDPTVGTTPTATSTNTTTVNIALKDVPLIVEIPAGAACPLTAGGFADGCAAAPTAAIQFPTLLDGYVARPPWNAAGVDYAVGIPTGTVLKDPAVTTIPTGCSANFGNHQITCSSGTPTFDSWDFSLEGGWQLICSGGTVTVTKSNFKQGSNNQDMLVAISGCGGVLLTYSKLDQNNSSGGNGSIISALFNGAGTFFAEYNYFANPFADVLDVGPTTETIKFNLIAGATSGGHPDWLQTGSGLYNIDTEFNTVLATPSSVGSQGYGYGGNPGGNIGNSTLAFNTTVTQSGANINFEYTIDPTQTTGAVTTHDNYSDTTGGAFGSGIGSFARSGSSCNPCSGGGTSTFSHNVNMVDGTLFTNNP